MRQELGPGAQDDERAGERDGRSVRLAENVPPWLGRRTRDRAEDSPRSRQLLRLADPPVEPDPAAPTRKPRDDDPLVLFAGQHWRLCPDGSLKRWDVASGAWTTLRAEDWSEEDATYLTNETTAQERAAEVAVVEQAPAPSPSGSTSVPGCTCLGGTLPSLCLYGKYTLVFERDAVSLRSRQAGATRIPFEEVREVRIGGHGRGTAPPARESFGLAGAMEGRAAAAVVRSLVERTSMDTSITLDTSAGEAVFHCDRIEADALRSSLAPFLGRLRRRRAAEERGGRVDATRDLVHLADLKARGLLTEQEFASAVAAALDGTL